MQRIRTRRRLLGEAAALTALPLAPRQAVAAQDDGTNVTTPAPPSEVEALFPSHRVLSYYGFPGNELMGILGEHSKEELLKRLKRQARAYRKADPDRPFKLAFEVIASVAQRDAMPDDSYLFHTDPDVLDDYAAFCAENDLLLILDMQFGRTSVADEIDAVRPWLALPHVHLALDPEFAVKEGEQPGVDLGSLDADDITFAQEEIARFTRQRGLPEKMLIIHQFTIYSITNKERIEPVPGVQLVLEIDGFGTPDEKRLTYSVLTEQPIEHHGFKLWYNGQDDPLMTPEEVLALSPSPDLIIYQ